MLLKRGGKLEDLSSYRSLFLTDSVVKTIANFILERVEVLAERSLPDWQAGFRSGRSCSQQHFTLRSLQQHCTDSNTPLVVAFLDFKRAFDSIPKWLIIDRLRHIGCPAPLLKMVRAMNCGVRATMSGSRNACFETSRGVRQVSR